MGRREVYAVELKTGFQKKRSYEFQVKLYSLLLSELYPSASANNLLVYLQEPESTQLVYWNDTSLEILIQHRNRLLYHQLNKAIPKPPKSKFSSIIEVPCFKETVEQLRLKIVEGAFSLTKYSPMDSGFQLTLEKDITEKIKGKKFEPKFNSSTKVMLRADKLNVVF
jgi:hypothetical protein